MPSINDELKATAEFAIKAAKEKFKIELDYSENSLKTLDKILEQTYQQINLPSNKEKISSAAVFRTANIWGSYLGEIIRQKWRGDWIDKDSKKLLILNGIEFSPIDYIYQRITISPQLSVEKYFAEAGMRIAPSPESDPKNSIPEVNNVVNEKKEHLTAPNGLHRNIGIAVGLLLVGILVVSMIFYFMNRIPDEFRLNLNIFLADAEKLNVITKQGVSKEDFRNQLAQVKSSYSIIENSWPSSLKDSKSDFDLAIAGWDLTVKVWDSWFDEYNCGSQVVPQSFCDGIESYTGDSSTHWKKSELGSLLMGTASQYYEEGRNSIRDKLK